MNKEKQLTNKSLKNIVLAKIFITILLSSIALGVILILMFITYHQFTFYGDETVYILAQMIKYYLPCLVIFVWLIDIICVILYYWKKSLGHIEIMMDASKQLILNDDNSIHFPDELKEVEEQMNQIKQKTILNAQLAKESEKQKNDLIVYLAHDLKTPLTSVIGYLNLLNDEEHISDELRKKYLNISLEKAERLEELINEFFDITRFNLSNLTLELSNINLTRMIEQIVYEFKPMLATKNLRCDLQITSNIEFKCDVNKIERVFDNLIRNAINYSFENGLIKIIVEKKSDGIYMCFSNKGNVIPKERLNLIFDQFYRLDSSRGTKTGGAGLGLAIAKKIIEAHKGTISAYSEEEEIRFEIYLPSLL